MHIYLIAKLVRRESVLIYYRVLDIDSGEIREVDSGDLIAAIKNNPWAFKNISIKLGQNRMNPQYGEQHDIIYKEGQDEIPYLNEDGRLTSNKKYILVSVDYIKYTAKMAKFDGEILDINLDAMYDLGRNIAGITTMLGGEYRNLLETEPTKDELLLLEKTDKLYESFIAMTRTLGIDSSFKYRISGSAVILQSYTGTSKHAIVPKLVDVIDAKAFIGRQITDLSLNDGLKTIGVGAFKSNNIGEVDIPRTVTVIGRHAFYGNDKLFKQTRQTDGYTLELNREKFRVYNKNTIISRQINY